jgi:hypothetical protein
LGRSGSVSGLAEIKRAVRLFILTTDERALGYQ